MVDHVRTCVEHCAEPYTTVSLLTPRPHLFLHRGCGLLELSFMNKLLTRAGTCVINSVSIGRSEVISYWRARDILFIFLLAGERHGQVNVQLSCRRLQQADHTV